MHYVNCSFLRSVENSTCFTQNPLDLLYRMKYIGHLNIFRSNLYNQITFNKCTEKMKILNVDLTKH